MTESLAYLLYDLATANRVVANEGVLDAFGHISIRHPTNPARYFLSCSRSPELVEVDDLHEYDLDSQPTTSPKHPMYLERVIHGEIYKARPDVMAVCHHHSPAVLPYCISGERLVPVFILGGVLGYEVPFWDQRDDFGDTNMLVQRPDEGASLARALGQNMVVLMRNHGAAVVAKSLQELVFRTIYGARNAEYQTQAKSIGNVRALSAGEVALIGALSEQPGALSRAWEYWVTRLAKRGDLPKRTGASKIAIQRGCLSPAQNAWRVCLNRKK
jgi:ribulose-5-phosphate 4-epimerase/fuculose-1-phosphate aldolase